MNDSAAHREVELAPWASQDTSGEPRDAQVSHDSGSRRAAFGDRAGADGFVLAAAAEAGRPRERWLAAVVLGGQGRYAAAAGALRALVTPSQPPLWRSLAASTLASHRRQLGGHALAARLDAVALRWAPPPDRGDAQDPDGVDATGARVDALTGLAADALGLGRLDTAARLLDAATAALGAADAAAWRLAVRLDWVRAELLLAQDRATEAVAPARRALRVAGEARAARHLAKSQLVLAAALHACGAHPEAEELLHNLTMLTISHRLLPLRWPAELILSRTPGHANHVVWHEKAAAAALRQVFRRADHELRTAAESSLWVPSGVLQTGDSAERSSAGEILSEICTGLCQGSTPHDR